MGEGVGGGGGGGGAVEIGKRELEKRQDKTKQKSLLEKSRTPSLRYRQELLSVGNFPWAFHLERSELKVSLSIQIRTK